MAGITSGNTILITGGGSGIGLVIAKRFVTAGNIVIACGRRKEQLEAAKAEVPGLLTLQGDVETEQGRVAIFESVKKDHPAVNVLINNAGMQNRTPPITQPQDWAQHERELQINLHAPIHLCQLFAPFLAEKKSAFIVNVTSGLAFVPLAFMPTYCVTKAAMHSFTLSLRHQLAKTSIRVIEMIPPAVNTDLGGKGLHDSGMPLDEYADDAFKHLQAGDEEFGVGFSEKGRNASRAEVDKMFASMNGSHAAAPKTP